MHWQRCHIIIIIIIIIIIKCTSKHICSGVYITYFTTNITVINLRWLDWIHPASPMHRAACWRHECGASTSFHSRLIPFFGGSSSPHLFSSSLVCQVFSWIPQLPNVALASECVLYPLMWHSQAIAYFFLGSPSQEVFFPYFFICDCPSRWYQECLSTTCGMLLSVSCSMWR